MKKFLLLLALFSCTPLLGWAQSSVDFQDVYKASVTQATDVNYRLYPTNNMWTFLKLDTRTGKVWLVQYSVEDTNNEMEAVVNDIELADKTDENRGRFTLYATSNLWNYILLDQVNGRTFAVQWSQKASNRGVRGINPYGNEGISLEDYKKAQAANNEMTPEQKIDSLMSAFRTRYPEIKVVYNENDTQGYKKITTVRATSYNIGPEYFVGYWEVQNNLKLRAKQEGADVLWIENVGESADKNMIVGVGHVYKK